jgi:hypothetical protein
MVHLKPSERTATGASHCMGGPPRSARAKGRGSVRYVAPVSSYSQASCTLINFNRLRVALQAVVAGSRDPGYLETSRIALEAGLCLALQGEELSEKGHLQGGVLTPASAMGSVLRERLKAANIRFEITKTGRETPPPSPLDKLKAAPKAAGTSAGEKSVAAAPGGNKQAHVLMFDCMHAVGDKLQRSLKQRGNIVQKAHMLGFDHLHPAINVAGCSFRRCGQLLKHHQHALQTCVLDVQRKLAVSRVKLQDDLKLAYAENSVILGNSLALFL